MANGFLKELLENHQKDLEKVIDKEISGDENNISYVSKTTVDTMLDDHFKKVEELLQNYQQQSPNNISLSQITQEIQEAFKKMLQQFSDSIRKIAAEAKKNMNQKVDQVKDTVTDVKTNATNQIRSAVDGVNSQIKELTESIDKKFDLTYQIQDEENINAYEEALTLQENYGKSSNVVEWNDEGFIEHLKENDPKAHDQFLKLKDLNEKQGLNTQVSFLEDQLDARIIESKELNKKVDSMSNKFEKLSDYFKNNPKAFKDFQDFENNKENKVERITENEIESNKEQQKTKSKKREESISL